MAGAVHSWPHLEVRCAKMCQVANMVPRSHGPSMSHLHILRMSAACELKPFPRASDLQDEAISWKPRKRMIQNCASSLFLTFHGFRSTKVTKGYVVWKSRDRSAATRSHQIAPICHPRDRIATGWVIFSGLWHGTSDVFIIFYQSVIPRGSVSTRVNVRTAGFTHLWTVSEDRLQSSCSAFREEELIRFNADCPTSQMPSAVW